MALYILNVLFLQNIENIDAIAWEVVFAIRPFYEHSTNLSSVFIAYTVWHISYMQSLM